MGSHKVLAKRKPSRVNRCSLVLWGDHFDEMAATIFTVALRKAGLCTKIVGVNDALAVGCNGLALYADLPLSAVMPLVDDMLCLILPCDRATVKRFENDPHVHALFAAAIRRQAKFVFYDHSIIKNSSLNSLAIPSEDIAAYAQADDLMAFAQEVATTLSYLEKSSYRRTATVIQPVIDHLV